MLYVRAMGPSKCVGSVKMDVFASCVVRSGEGLKSRRAKVVGRLPVPDIPCQEVRQPRHNNGMTCCTECCYLHPAAYAMASLCSSKPP